MAALVVISTVCAQWNFTVDPTFQTQIVQQNVNSLLLNEDGSLIASGRIRFPGDMANRSLVCLLPNGISDGSFPNLGHGGSKITPWLDRFYVGSGQIVRRMQMNGTLDPTYIGMNLGPYFSSLQGGDYHVYPDGRVLISGRHMLSDSIRGFMGPHNLIWFSNTGYLDTTQTHRKGASCAVYRFKELPNGQFICSGTCTQFEGQEVDWIFRVNADGSPDTTFRTGVYIGDAQDYLPLGDGRVYAGGNFRRTQFPLDTLRLVRFLPNGDLDPTFSIPQFTAGEGLSTPYGAYVHGITPWRNGTLIITGQFKRVNGLVRKGICLIDTTGQLLDAFSDAGVGPFTYFSITTGGLLRPLFNADSTQLYICGAYSGYDDGLMNYPEQRFITRLNVEEVGTGVPEQPTPTYRLYPNPASTTTTLALEEVPRGAVLVLRDALGREQLRQTVRGHYTTLELQTLSDGIYFVELRSGERRMGVQRLVVAVSY